MADFENLIENAIAEAEIPGCVLNAVNRDATFLSPSPHPILKLISPGSFKYAKASGKRSVRPGSDQSPLQLSSVMWIASCAKLMTSICAF